MNKTYRLIWSHQQQKLVAVSECTRGRGKSGSRALTLLAAAIASAFSFAGAAQAACTAGPDTFTCSGAETSTRTLSGAPLSLTLDPTFSMNAAAGNGLVLTGTNGLTVTQTANGGNLTAQGTAVDARNTGAGGTGLQVLLNGDISGYTGVLTQSDTGSTTITVSGSVALTSTANFSRGVYATAGATATDMRITTADITGGSSGVWTFNQGVGSLTIDTTAGSVLGASRAGVWGQNWSNTNTFMTITTADVYGGEFGITTNHNGTGSLTINSTAGNVTGLAITGIGGYIYNPAATGDLTITSANVHSNDKGIWAYQAGTGATVINTTAGTVTSTNTTGILAEMLVGSGNLTITTADVTGGQYGIRALNNGIGSATIDSTGGTVATTIGSNYYSAAILARTSATSTDLTITTATVDGARSGIRAYHLGTGQTTIDTTAGTVAGNDLDGIFARNGSNATDLSITTATITSAQYGVAARNYGTGSATIDTTRGSITASSGDGVSVFTSHTAANLTITTADVFGGTSGMVAYNFGNGSTTIDTMRGSVTGGVFQGINAVNDPSTTDLTITTADVTGGAREGILAQNNGTGSTTIDTTAGSVTGGTRGIRANNGATTTDLRITTANVTGGQSGVVAENSGTGATMINTVAGTVSGAYSDGILARHAAITATDITITTADVTGVRSGVYAVNQGSGSTTINTVAGNVTATGQSYSTAISVWNQTNAVDIAITTANVSGRYGITAFNQGIGSTTINSVGGTVTATRYTGISVGNVYSSTDLTITSANVTGVQGGIFGRNQGIGATTIDTVAGTVTGTTSYGVRGENASTATNLSITTANVSGATHGILAQNAGTGATAITVAAGGVVQGGTAGISASHASANPFTITINGEVRNSSGVASDLAITAASTGRGLTLNNNSNTIIGTVNLTAADDTFNNVGSWFTENGASDFGGGNDVLNNSGFIRAANNGALAETTRFNNLELFNHSGIVTLQDGAVGDRLITSGNFAGNGGAVRLDTVLDTGTGGSDILEINGNATGTARLRIANVGGTGGQTTGNGIQVVQVNGTSTANAFSLAAPVKAGIWNYALDFGGANNTDQNWYLVTQGFSEVAAVYESAPRILLDTLQPLSTLQQRIGQRQVHGADNRQGAWIRLVGEWQDVQPRRSTADSRWKTDTATLQLGYDRLVSQSDNGDWVLGLTAHHSRTDAVIKNPTGRGNLDGEGYGGGLTLTWYGNQDSYLDLQASASILSTDFASRDLGELEDRQHGWAYSVSAELGHRKALDERHTLIPQLQVQHKRLRYDSFDDQLGNRVSLGNPSSTELRLGLAWERLSTRKDRFYLIGNLLHDFSPRTDVLVNGVHLRAKTPENAFEAGFGGTMALNQSLFLYGEGNYRKDLGGGKYDSYLLTAGLRLAW